jgi:23S rRNA (uridine2552-2'-O)-methyltransferase
MGFGAIPVKEGEVRELQIVAIGEKGDGIAKIEGFVIVVPNTEEGKNYRVKITAIRGKVGFGEVVRE